MSEIKTDKLTGVGTASTITIANNEIVGASSGNITIPGEGGTTKTNLQQGLAKVWSRFNGSTASTTDSFNQASFVDAGTGIYQINMNNPYTGIVGAHTTCSGNFHSFNRSTGTATQIEIGIYNSQNNGIDESRCFIISHGDLA